MDKSIFLFLSELTILIHFLWILFLIFGSFIGIKYKTLKYLHIFGLGFSIFLQIFELQCPLTYLEIWFKQKAGLKGYEGGFIAFYLEKIVYIQIEPAIIFIATLILVLVHFYVYKNCSRGL
ncbi:MAG TPA: DUF2784 domain-containing protein [Sulfurihydrogenibium sp.]|uniref:DUF2784 domain-containing protein n=1 Tax=Sulfurihydrogenibium sp. (strain YO3AOP1) TaxID=436114 RepID=UPI0001722DD6|nr:DUF2784 domain-containing protein [Sulfurihydrogenibium sp. YO3AOP1]ACD65869.1 conserved hypothetical protein [Sulfurihydrogenibium sp. YO3AOP1]HBT99114.1 DUF2784 domain-containing protein [Sulfurihydrogenibium sp.]